MSVLVTPVYNAPGTRVTGLARTIVSTGCTAAVFLQIVMMGGHQWAPSPTTQVRWDTRVTQQLLH